jgi:hypothetical protein
MPSNIQIWPAALEKINKLLDPNRGGPQKIKAIKTLRNNVVGEPGASLRDAKRAIERLQYEKFNGTSIPQESDPRVFAGPRIKKLTVDLGDGDIEVDIEGLQLRMLMQLESIGLDACREILHLVDVLQAFSNGKKVVIIEDEETENSDT